MNSDNRRNGHRGARSCVPVSGTTVLLCDERREVRQAVQAALGEQPGFTVVGQAVDAIGCLTLITLAVPDILILDPRVPGAGPDLVTAAKKLHPGLHVLVYSGVPDHSLQRAMFAAGADQYLVKTGRLEPLLAALGRAAGSRRDTDR